MVLTSCVDVAVLPIDFNHEITWTEHLFDNYLGQLYSANALDNDIQWQLFHLWMQIIGGLALGVQLCSQSEKNCQMFPLVTNLSKSTVVRFPNPLAFGSGLGERTPKKVVF